MSPGSCLPRARRVAFDFDGTIADSFPLFLDAFDGIARRHGFRALTTDQLHGLRGLSSREFIAHAGLPAWKLPAVMHDFRRHMAAHAREIRMFDGVSDALRALAASGVRLAVVTSNAEPTVRAVLGDAIAACFTHIDCGISLFGKAPRLRRLVHGHALALPPVYVGDELRDADAARSAGYAFGAVAWGYNEPAALQAASPAYFFPEPAALARLA